MRTGTPKSRPGLSHLGKKLQDSVLPVRRMLSRAALVYEERHFRDVAVDGVYSALAAEGKKIRAELKSLEERAIVRVDILIEELWRRTEGVGARHATEIQRLAASLSRLQSQTAAQISELQHVAAQMAEAQQLAAEVARLRIRGGAAPAEGRSRWEPLIKHFQGLEPVAHLGCGQGDFLDLALSFDLAAYGVDPDPEAVARCREAGLDARQSDVVEHLRAVEPGSLGGAFCSRTVDHLRDGSLGDLMVAVAGALRPGGVAIFEAPDAISHQPADLLAAAARASGLEIDDAGSPYPPDSRMPGVSPDLSDPSLREIAHGINTLVAQLNDVLYGPQDHALVARRPG